MGSESIQTRARDFFDTLIKFFAIPTFTQRTVAMTHLISDTFAPSDAVAFAPLAARPQLIIFDCDGVLIDSEYLAAKAQSLTLKNHGIDISAEDFMHRFAGYTDNDLWATLATEHRVQFPHEMEILHERNVVALFQKELSALAGAHALIAWIQAAGIPLCIASNSGPDRLEFSLKLAGLWDHFTPHIFSSRCVTRPKPAPDIYLYAAHQFDVAPQHCLVIEDSIAGVRAGHQAGMAVVGFTGARHCPPRHDHALTNEGARWIFHSMDKLQEWLKSIEVGTRLAAQNNSSR
jgi:HAD superfamily hydrolase (TIGR01509 family)